MSQVKSKIRIVFLGTPDFAVSSLTALVDEHFTIAGVVTAPDKPAGRGMKLTESAVKRYAVEKGLNILQPEKLKDPKFLEQLKSLRADLQIVVAFRMLPELVWNMPAMGTINLHASLLPDYRGAAPINWAIINGEKETGATTFKLRHEIDTGNILLQEKLLIHENETAGELHDRLKLLGSQLVIKTVQGLESGTQKEIPQVETGNRELKKAPKIFTETGRINWNKSVGEIHNLIRGLSPQPAAFTELEKKILKIYRSEKEIIKPTVSIGQIETDNKTFLKFACTDGYIHVRELQLEGKKKMNVEDFLRGHKIAN
jgi:methionyl-tRNA formyltransferase